MLSGGAQVVQHTCTEEEVGSTLVEELCLQQPRVDVTELEDARWFHRSWLSRHLAPARVSIHPLLPCLAVLLGDFESLFVTLLRSRLRLLGLAVVLFPGTCCLVIVVVREVSMHTRILLGSSD